MRSSPALVRLPRREVGVDGAAVSVVRLRTTEHRGASRAVPELFSQLTVPAEIARQLPEDARFSVHFEGDSITYRLRS